MRRYWLPEIPRACGAHRPHTHGPASSVAALHRSRVPLEALDPEGAIRTLPAPWARTLLDPVEPPPGAVDRWTQVLDSLYDELEGMAPQDLGPTAAALVWVYTHLQRADASASEARTLIYAVGSRAMDPGVLATVPPSGAATLLLSLASVGAQDHAVWLGLQARLAASDALHTVDPTALCWVVCAVLGSRTALPECVTAVLDALGSVGLKGVPAAAILALQRALDGQGATLPHAMVAEALAQPNAVARLSTEEIVALACDSEALDDAALLAALLDELYVRGALGELSVPRVAGLVALADRLEVPYPPLEKAFAARLERVDDFHPSDFAAVLSAALLPGAVDALLLPRLLECLLDPDVLENLPEPLLVSLVAAVLRLPLGVDRPLLHHIVTSAVAAGTLSFPDLVALFLLSADEGLESDTLAAAVCHWIVGDADSLTPLAPETVAALLRALGLTGAGDPAALVALCDHIVAADILDRCGLQGVADVAWAATRLGLRHEGLTHALHRAAAAQLRPVAVPAPRSQILAAFLTYAESDGALPPSGLAAARRLLERARHPDGEGAAAEAAL